MSQSTRIEKVPRDKLPPGTRILTKAEVFEHYIKLIQSWKPDSEVWALKYGWMLLGTASTMANFYILRQYRKRLKLHDGLMAVLTIGTAILPGLAAPVSHAYFVTQNIFTQEGCLGCLHIKAVTCQLLSVLGYGLTINPLLCFMKAQHLATYNVPGYYTPEQRRKTWELYLKFTRRSSRSIYIHSFINSIAATVITAKEINNFTLMNQKLLDKEAEVSKLKKKLHQ